MVSADGDGPAPGHRRQRGGEGPAVSLPGPDDSSQAGAGKTSGGPVARAVRRELRRAALRFDEHVFRRRGPRSGKGPARLFARSSARLSAASLGGGGDAGRFSAVV